jgi:hypothetical protein
MLDLTTDIDSLSNFKRNAPEFLRQLLADESPDAAARWYVGLEKAFATLKKFPNRHPIAEEESEQLGITVRHMLFGRRRGVYRVLFSVEADTLHYVRHGAQGPIEPQNPPQ